MHTKDPDPVLLEVECACRCTHAPIIGNEHNNDKGVSIKHNNNKGVNDNGNNHHLNTNTYIFTQTYPTLAQTQSPINWFFFPFHDGPRH